MSALRPRLGATVRRSLPKTMPDMPQQKMVRCKTGTNPRIHKGEPPAMPKPITASVTDLLKNLRTRIVLNALHGGPHDPTCTFNGDHGQCNCRIRMMLHQIELEPLTPNIPAEAEIRLLNLLHKLGLMSRQP